MGHARNCLHGLSCTLDSVVLSLLAKFLSKFNPEMQAVKCFGHGPVCEGKTEKSNLILSKTLQISCRNSLTRIIKNIDVEA